MKPKTLLITTVLGLATTTAFGAASLRASQMGGTATVTTPAATTNTARAGTMRTQTMKTSSVSTPSVTTTQSIATPVSTETTDARIALLKGIKGFNPGKIKDTAAAQQELNAIDSRIEELQSKLDQAETAADQTAKLTDVYTKEQVEAKINEKISAIGTSTSAKETYSKTEINKLLPYKENGLVYLPVLPGQPGSGDIGTATPTVIAPEWRFRNMGFETYDNNMVTIHKFVTLAPNNEITNFVNEFCHDIESGNSYWCGKYGDTLPYNNDTGERMFKIRHRQRGYVYHTQIGENKWYYTNEPNPETYINTQICGNPNGTTECGVIQSETQSDPHVKYNVEVAEPEYYFNYIGGDHGIAMGGNALTYLQHFATNAPLDSTAIDDFFDSYCGDREPFWCGKNSVQVVGDQRWLNIKERFHGYVLRSIEMSSVGTYSTYWTNEDEPATYINTNVCGNPNGTTNCYVVNVDDLSLEYPSLLDPTSVDVSDRYRVTVFTTPRHETELPAPLIK